MEANKELFPPIKLYSEYLHKIVVKFGISIDNARNKYGLYTINQFENLLNN